MVSMGGRRLSLGVLRPFGVSLVSFAVVSLVIAPTLGDDVFGFEDGFGDLFELSPTLAAAVGAEDPGNETSEMEGETVPSPLAMDGITFVVPDSDLGDDRNRTRGANFSFELPAGWTATSAGDRNDGNLTLEGNCARAFIGWFEDVGVDPDLLLRQVVRAYRSGSIRFTVLEAEPGGAVEVDGLRGSTLNIYYMYSGQESQKRLVAWPSPRSGRIFYASFWSCSDGWEENLEEFESVLASFRDEPFEGYAVFEPRSAAFDGWGTVLSETLQSYRFGKVAAPSGPEVTVRVSLTSHREDGRVDQLASEEIASSTRGAEVPSREAALKSLLVDEGYRAVVLRRGGAFWVAVQGPEGRWQAISPADAGDDRSVGTLVGPADDAEWYRGLVVAGPETAGEPETSTADEPEMADVPVAAEALERSGWTVGAAEDVGFADAAAIEKRCDPPHMVRLAPMAEVNLTWVLEIKDLLDRYSYSQEEADPGSFLRSQVCWALIEREGHDAILVTGYEGHPLHPRMWVAVKHPGELGYIAVDPAAGDGGLGEIVHGAEYFEGIGYETSGQYSCLHPDRGLSIDPGTVGVPAQGEAAS